MVPRCMLLIVILALLAGSALAQDDETPTIAFLQLGPNSSSSLSEKGIFDMFEAYGFINAEERAALHEMRDLEGERVNIIYGNAGFDIATANLLLEDALDRGADALVTLSTQVTQLAVAATREMEDPPAIVFSLVTTPYIAGIADAPCLKPAHVAGTQPIVDFQDIVPLLLLQDPNMKVVGTFVSPEQPTSVYGANKIKEIGESLGLTVEVASVAALPDLNIAIEGLASKGAEAIMYPISSIAVQGLPILLALSQEYSIPLFAPVMPAVYRGATVGAGFRSFYEEGVIAGRMIIGHLNGDIDLAEIRINSSHRFGVALNQDSARAQNVVLSDELLARAEYVIVDGKSSEGVTPDLPELVTSLPEIPLEERRAADLEFLARLKCTDEMIAEQQAALDAADG